MISQLQNGIPKLIASFDGVITIYVRQYGAGNLRIGMNGEDLRNSISLAPGQFFDGIPQVAADGIKQYFWSGDLWVISDNNDAIMVLFPAQSFYLNRTNSQNKQPSDVDPDFAINDLSTYQS